MRAPKYKRDFWWARWEGGVSDVAEITRLAEKLVGNVRNNVTVEIRVETPIVDTEYLDVDEFESHVADSELEAIRSISVHAYDGGESGWNIKLWFGKRSPVVLLHVSGSEPTFVVGAAQQVREAINDRRHRTMFGPEKLGIAGGVAVFGLIFTIAAFATFRVYDEWEYRLLNLLLVSTLASAWGLGRPSGFRLGSRTSTLFHLAGEP